MEARLQRRIQRYGWDRASGDYEAYWSRQIAPAHERLLAMAALTRGEHVLDVACGTGLVSFAAAEAVRPDGAVTGTDISDRMIEEAGKRAESRGLHNVRFERADAEEMDFPAGAFDAALCSLGLMYVPDPVAALRRMRGFLRPGGRAVAAVWGQRNRCGWAGIFPIVDARVRSEVCPLFFQLGTGDTLRRAMEHSGFRDIEVDRIQNRLYYSSAADAIGAAFIGGPVAMAYSRFDEQTRAEVHAEYLETIERYRDGEGYSIPGEFVIAVGRV
jgi:ubiquinone/menaquinone biosynthesis C-methylase UbiE